MFICLEPKVVIYLFHILSQVKVLLKPKRRSGISFLMGSGTGWFNLFHGWWKSSGWAMVDTRKFIRLLKKTE
jgi:hypothetical protein